MSVGNIVASEHHPAYRLSLFGWDARGFVLYEVETRYLVSVDYSFARYQAWTDHAAAWLDACGVVRLRWEVTSETRALPFEVMVLVDAFVRRFYATHSRIVARHRKTTPELYR